MMRLRRRWHLLVFVIATTLVVAFVEAKSSPATSSSSTSTTSEYFKTFPTTIKFSSLLSWKRNKGSTFKRSSADTTRFASSSTLDSLSTTQSTWVEEYEYDDNDGVMKTHDDNHPPRSFLLSRFLLDLPTCSSSPILFSSSSSPSSSSSSWKKKSKRKSEMFSCRTTRGRGANSALLKSLIPTEEQQQQECVNSSNNNNNNNNGDIHKQHHGVHNRRMLCSSSPHNTHLVCRGGCKDDGGSIPHSSTLLKKPRRACGVYIWNAPSALLYKWCHHLLKDNLYEGRGGVLFVRYESNSILQLLYPCNRYSPNQCLICGGSFPDHLELWWSRRHLYSPYDRYLDTTYKKGLILQQDEESETQNRRQQQRLSRSTSSSLSLSSRSRKGASSSRRKTTTTTPPSQPTIIKQPPKFSFHKAYVKDVSDWIGNEKSSKRQMEMIKSKLLEEQKESAKKNRNRRNNKGKDEATTVQTTTKGMRLTRFPQYDVAYILPTTTTTKSSSSGSGIGSNDATTKEDGNGSKRSNKNNKFNNNDNNNNSNNNNFVKSLIRSITISTLDDFIMLQEKENNKLSGNR